MWNRLAARDMRFAPRTRVKASEELTPALVALCSPLAAMALALGIWALASQAALAANFPIANGALADWRVWLLIAGALEFTSLRFRSQNQDR